MSTAPPTTAPPSDAWATQTIAEILRNVPDVVARATQVQAEILRNVPTDVRSSQIVIEVLRERPPFETTKGPTTTPPTTLAPTTLAPTTAAPTTSTTAAPTTAGPTTAPPTTAAPTTILTTGPPVWTLPPLTYPAPTSFPTTSPPVFEPELATTLYPDVAHPLLCDEGGDGTTIFQVCVEVPAFTKTALMVSQFGPEFFVGRLTELPMGQPDDDFPPPGFPPTPPGEPGPGEPPVDYPYDAIGFIEDDVSSQDVGNR